MLKKALVRVLAIFFYKPSFVQWVKKYEAERVL